MASSSVPHYHDASLKASKINISPRIIKISDSDEDDDINVNQIQFQEISKDQGSSELDDGDDDVSDVRVNVKLEVKEQAFRGYRRVFYKGRKRTPGNPTKNIPVRPSFTFGSISEMRKELVYRLNLAGFDSVEEHHKTFLLVGCWLGFAAVKAENERDRYVCLPCLYYHPEQAALYKDWDRCLLKHFRLVHTKVRKLANVHPVLARYKRRGEGKKIYRDLSTEEVGDMHEYDEELTKYATRLVIMRHREEYVGTRKQLEECGREPLIRCYKDVAESIRNGGKVPLSGEDHTYIDNVCWHKRR
eukprot:Plantae.Rhodophyta-Hildenbrandia_rubra.ctg6500.p1 GENE.Plantae.Rhodophyta-Hildenbrandia_rubra.ctg6500~~Plantae.Rhodophyta-Hildenbrandia_rubra.ctg6500.p1  ORF type:complete len:302 (-),score=40.93 Plantae.Rhodophyta-Hildenbrandia_rubra.ctg6500:862-1767(-)